MPEKNCGHIEITLNRNKAKNELGSIVMDLISMKWKDETKISRMKFSSDIYR